MQIQGSVALVTGAGSGLGAATAARLAQRGALVVGADLNPAAVKDVLADAPRSLAVEADVTDTDAVAQAVATAMEAGPLRIVVHCAAGGFPPGRTVQRNGSVAPLDPWRRTIELNLVASFDVTRQAAGAMATLPSLEDDARGVILHTSSIAGLDGSQGVSAYASSKMALVAMVHSTARDLSIWGIRVLGIAPGPFDTPAFSSMPAAIQEQRMNDYVFPKRPGRPSEFAAFAEHLIENDYLNADVYRIDAGMRMHQ